MKQQSTLWLARIFQEKMLHHSSRLFLDHTCAAFDWNVKQHQCDSGEEHVLLIWCNVVWWIDNRLFAKTGTMRCLPWHPEACSAVVLNVVCCIVVLFPSMQSSTISCDSSCLLSVCLKKDQDLHDQSKTDGTHQVKAGKGNFEASEGCSRPRQSLGNSFSFCFFHTKSEGTD